MNIPYELIGQYLSGEASEEQVTELMAWRKENNANEEAFMQVMTAWGHSFNELSQYEAVSEKAYEETWQQIAKQEDKKGFNVWWAVAASIVILLGVWSIYNFSDSNAGGPRLVMESAGDSIKQISLPDGSQVWLNAFSEIAYVEGFAGENRQVTLKGEAYFEVARDEDKPFVITAGQSKTTVLGTAFNLRAAEDERVYLTVTEGKVSFSDADAAVIAYVAVGEEAVLSTGNQTIDKKVSDDPNAMAWKTGKLVFTGKSLSAIAEDLSDYYGVEYTVEQSLQDKSYAFTLDRYSLEEANTLIENITGLKIVEKGKTYHITR